MSDMPEWEKQGFAQPPVQETSDGGERVVRAHSEGRQQLDWGGNRHGSFARGNCFFILREDFCDGKLTSKVSEQKLGKLSAEDLEKNLNAGLWNNSFQNLSVFSLPAGIRYLVGPVGHNTRTKEKFGSEDPNTGGIVTHAGEGQMAPNDPYLRDCLQVVLVNPKDVDRLTPVGGPRKVPGSEAFMGQKSAMWH